MVTKFTELLNLLCAGASRLPVSFWVPWASSRLAGMKQFGKIWAVMSKAYPLDK